MLGNVDQMEVPDPPDGPPFRAPGRLDPPVVGRFTGDRGLFECSDVLGGRPVQVRFEWLADRSAPVWQQSFSWDDGATWVVTWEMHFSR